ncbi:hypothetical protein CDL15_Pgr005376 [Punica granatum]|uniref:Serine aminopeptidase S33 domain-containing protein n=1 Tax=Punica granatum TaxID=22663 RepID=A0A218XE45_PUNGR|nr:hypothetical protein CDL15_Pgr005376 [Punica granatum]
MFVVKPARGTSTLIRTNNQIPSLPQFTAKISSYSPTRSQQSFGVDKGVSLLEVPPTPVMAVEARSSSASSTLILTSGASGRISALFSVRAMRSLMMLIHAFILLLLMPFRGRPKRASASSGVVDKATGAPDEKKQAEGSGGIAWRPGSSAVVRVPTRWWKAAAAAVDQEVATRRALAKRRVIQEDDDKNCAREFSLFNTSHTLFTQSWTPLNVKIRGLVVLLHGLNEHSGRYSDFAKKLNANGFKVYGMDWIGKMSIPFRMLCKARPM